MNATASLHILLIHQAFASASDPGGTRHFEFAQHFRRAGHRTTIIGGAASYLTGAATRSEQHDGIRIVRPYTHRAVHRSHADRVTSFVTFMASSFSAALTVRDVDVVYGTSPPIFQGLTAWAVARLKRVPLVFEVRDLWPDVAVEMGMLKNRALIWVGRRVERFLYERADLLVVNSPGFVEHVARVGKKVPTVVPNGVDVSAFSCHADAATIRQQWGARDCFVVLYAGAHGPANDLETVLEAAGLLRHRADILSVLVGDGMDKRRLQRRAADLALHNVHFADARRKGEMPAVLAAADAGLAILRDVPLFRTTYPNKVFDYMAAGKPCVLAIDGVIRRVVERAGCGVCVRPGDPSALAAAIEQLADDRARAASMGALGRAYVSQHFDRAQQAAALMQLLSGVLDEPAA